MNFVVGSLLYAAQLFMLPVPPVRQVLQEILDPLDAPAHTLGHQAVPVPVLREALPPEVGHEEAHLHPHR